MRAPNFIQMSDQMYCRRLKGVLLNLADDPLKTTSLLILSLSHYSALTEANRDQHLICPDNVTAQPNVKVRWTKEAIVSLG